MFDDYNPKPEVTISNLDRWQDVTGWKMSTGTLYLLRNADRWPIKAGASGEPPQWMWDLPVLQDPSIPFGTVMAVNVER